jgi:hypothetical protein
MDGSLRLPITCDLLRGSYAFSDQLIDKPHGTEAFLTSRQLLSCSTVSQHFMEPEGSISYLQEPAIDPYQKPIYTIPSFFS